MLSITQRVALSSTRLYLAAALAPAATFRRTQRVPVGE
jgi:hypothetical protein